MSNVQAKQRAAKAADKSHSGKKSDIVFYVAAIAAVALVLIFMPKFIAASGLDFLASGTGLNKLFSVVVAVGLGWLCLLPSQGYKDFVELAQGARIEWRKTVKPDRDTVVRTTMMVLALVAVFALFILVLDWAFGSILRALVN